MAAKKTMVYKEMDSRVFQIDENQKAAEVRGALTSGGYIRPDSDQEAWRFFIYNSQTTNFSDAILGKEVEQLVPIQGMYGPGEQLYLTNINKRKRPDLMGIGCDWFFDRYMSCKVSLNNSDSSARQKNEGKFQPMMMSHVRPTSKNVSGIYDYVVVCEKGSVITFNVSSWGAAGFGCSIKPEAGQSIADGLYVTFGNSPNKVGQTSLRRYASQAQQIVIDSTSSMNIPGGQSVQYQRVSVKTWRVTSYKSGGKTYSNNDQPQGPTGMRRYSAGPEYRHASGGITDRQLANSQVLPGDAITPGTAHPGDNSDQQIGTIYDVRDDHPAVLGEVLMYFFVFNSHEDAVRVIDQINSPNPNVWS